MPEDKKEGPPKPAGDLLGDMVDDMVDIVETAAGYSEQVSDVIRHLSGRVTRIEEALFKLTNGLIETFSEAPECCADEEDSDNGKPAEH